MKLFRYILSALAGVSLFASCIEEEPVASYNLAIELDKSVVAVGSEGGSATVEVNSGDITWKATSSADWITFTPATGSGTTKVTITVGASDEDRTGEVSLQAGNLEKLITIVQTGDPHGLTEDDPLTCAEAVVLCGKLADKATTPKKYYVKGIITAIVEEFGTQYGNATFWMGDAEGEKTFEAYRILYFDNVKYDDPTKQNISEGDNVVIYGVLMNYGGQAETSQNAAYLVKLDANTAPTISCKEPEKVVAASETEATFTIAPKNLTEGWTVSTDASWIKDYTKSGAKDATEIRVSFDANTETEAREATFTVKSAGAKDVTLTLKQGGYSAVGTLDNPYTVAQAIAAIKDGGVAGNVYVKGIISNTTKYNFGPTYNTASFWMSDDGVYNDDLEKDFEAYSVYWLGGTLEQPTAAEAIKANFMVGDEVVIYGALTSYTSSSTGLTTYETASKKAKIYSINWAKTDENGVGNADYPFNIAGAQKFIDDTQAAVKAASEAGSTLAIPDVCVKGKVSAVYSQYSAQYHTAIFWISEDGTFNGTEDKKKTTDYAHDFEAYSVYWLENKEWEEGMGTVKEGDDVILKGQYTIYNGLYETASKKAYLYSLNGVTEATPAEVVPELYLNEFDCQNKKIEIYNATDAEVDMTGWIILKNDGEEGEKDTFSIPAALAKVPAKGYAVFTCKQTDAANGPKFGLSGSADKGFKIALKKGETVVDLVDNLTAPIEIPDGKSWGRETDGAEKFVIFDTPTIGAANGSANPPAELGEYDTNVKDGIVTVSSAYTDGVATVNGTADVFTLKLGTSSKFGSATVTLPAGTKSVSFYAVAWKGSPASLKLTLGSNVIPVDIAANDGATGSSPYTITVADSDKYAFNLGGALSQDTHVTVETYEGTNNGKRAIIFGIQASKEEAEVPGPEAPSFAIDGDFSEWEGIEAYSGTPRNNGGDNTRINKWKVASDADNVYFYFELVTSKFITDAKKPNSYFYIGFDTDKDGSTGSAHGNVPGLEQYAVIYPCVADSDPVTFIKGVDPRSTVNGSADCTLTTWGTVDSTDGTKAYVELAIPRSKVSLTSAGSISVGASFQEYDTKMQTLELQ